MQTNQPAVAAVLFDFGMVLSGPPVPAVWQRMQHVSDIEAAKLEALYWAHRDDYDCGKLNAESYWRRIADEAAVPMSPAQQSELIALDVEMWTDMNLDMLDWITALHQAGVRTGILSNMGDGMAQGICERFAWLSDFHHCVWSHELHLKKPDEAIYAAAAKGLGVPAGAILFIDDKQENVLAAERFGMQAIQFSTFPALQAEMHRRGLQWLLHPEPVTASY